MMWYNQSMQFCDDPFWDSDVSWNTTSPSLTSCFRQAILSPVPFVSLILILPYDLFFLSKKWTNNSPPVPWQWANLLHLLVIILSMAVSSFYLIALTSRAITSQAVHFAAAFQWPVLNLICCLILLFLVFLFRRKNNLLSVCQPVFWCINSLCFALDVWSMYINEEESIPEEVFLISSCFLSVLGTIISCVPQKKQTNYQHLDQWQCPDYCPRSTTNVFSRLTFSWTWKFLFQHYNVSFEASELQPLCYYMRAEVVAGEFKKKYDSWCCSKKKRILLIIFKTSWFTLTITSILLLFDTVLTFSQPLLIGKVLDFIVSDEPAWHGFLFAFFFCFNWLVARIIAANVDTLLQIVAIRTQNALISMIYAKMLRLSPASKKKHDAGEINNYMNTDTNQIYAFIEIMNQFYMAPLNLLIATAILWQYLGGASLGLFGTMLVVGPITSFIMTRTGKMWAQQMELSDKRMKKSSEIFNNIKMLKLFAWEKPFMERVADIRKQETNKILLIHFWYAGIDLIWSWAPLLVTAVCFTLYVLVSNGIFDAKVAFVSLSVFNSMRSAMAIYPDVLVRMVRANVSCRRIREYFEAEEVEQNPNRILKPDSYSPPAGTVLIKNSSFSWDPKGDDTLSDINVLAAPGSLIAIVGQVGCGKSSLFSALLGDMYQVKGESPTIVGSLAFVPQTAWIQNNTLKKNVTFVKELDKEKYKKVISLCALEPDLAILPGGDETEIGEKGINLSGGQKQRVSLARAVYQDEDIYLLDDPLSAVDAHVAHQLFHQVIGPEGLLKSKTRLLATHHLSFLDKVDFIIVMKKGRIVAQGHYNQLQEKGLLQIDDDLVVDEEGAQKIERQISIVPSVSANSKTSNDLLIKRQTSTLSEHQNEGKKDEEDNSGQLTEEEYQEVGRVKLSNYWEYIKLVGIILFVSAFLVEFLNNFCEQAANYWLNLWTANNKTTAYSPERNANLWIYITPVILRAIFLVIANNLIFIGSRNAAILLHKKMLNSVLRSPLSFFDVTPIGRILNRFNRDILSVDEEVPLNFKFVIQSITWFPVIFAVITSVSVYLLLVIVIISVLFYLLTKLYLWTSRQLKRIESITRTPLFSHFNESIHGVSTIRAYNTHHLFIQELNKRADVNQNCSFVSYAVMQWFEIWSGIIGIIFMLAVSFYIVASRGSITQSLAGLLMTYLIDTVICLNWLTRVSTWLESNMVAVERIREFIRLKPEAVWQSNETVKKRLENWPKSGLIEFKEYTTKYRPELDPVLKNLTVTIESGEKIGVVGRTGAGKSSLTMALFRIIEPTSGKIIIDGVDVTGIGLHDLRSKLTIIPQEPSLFAGSLRINLDPFEEHSDEKLWQALEDSHLKEFVSSLSDGLQHEITASGDNLSAGQRQLVCLARALLRDSRILILDEATAACDNETDKLIQATIRNKFQTSTIITIAHRLNTILDYDRILVIADGTIVEVGSPKSLLNQSNSLFFEMAKEAGIIKQ